MKLLSVLTVTVCLLLFSCQQKSTVDLLIFNARVYTADENFTITESIAIKEGKIVATGPSDSLQKIYDAAEILDAEGKAVFPGFIDAHAHFIGYAQLLQTPILYGIKSWEEAVRKVSNFYAEKPSNGWIIGRGWDQNLWSGKNFPTKELLDKAFPDQPALLIRVDGHAAIANSVALKMADIKPGQIITGGRIVTTQNQLTGVLIDEAITLVSNLIPEATDSELREMLLPAAQNCYAAGLTSLHDCGVHYKQMLQMKKIQDSGQLAMRLYVMLNDAPDNFSFLKSQGIIKTDKMHVRSFKLLVDGALGSRGACLLTPYTDQPGATGFLLNDIAHYEEIARNLLKEGFQMNTHAIGDSGNRVVLQIYAQNLKPDNDLRWRIEHAQIIEKNDFSYFKKYNIIPSVQPTHATSDMYWAKDRIGEERMKGAYAYKELLKQNEWMPLGTDFPVEDISPFKTFYAAVARKDNSHYPATGFQTENALDRISTLKGMTIWAAKAAFEEKEKGSLEAGKFADFIILDKDIMTIPEKEILTTQVLKTYIGGKAVYEKQ